MDSEGFINIIKCIIALLGAIITCIIIPYIKSKTTEKQRNDITFWVQVAVSAAEQIYREKGQGGIKKQYVVDFLIDKGINISMSELNILIEASVKELNLVQQNFLK